MTHPHMHTHVSQSEQLLYARGCGRSSEQGRTSQIKSTLGFGSALRKPPHAPVRVCRHVWLLHCPNINTNLDEVLLWSYTA